MEYREIVSVTGIGGLFQLVATKSDGAIVRNIADKSIKFISARLHNVTPLESIEIYTIGNDNIRLHEVFRKMMSTASSEKIVDHKTADNNAIKGYFKSLFPEFDEERVYVSDMKKMLKWYDMLSANGLLDFEKIDAAHAAAEAEETAEEIAAPVVVEEVKEEKPAKKARAKKAEATTDGEAPAKPAKKTAKKKSEE